MCVAGRFGPIALSGTQPRAARRKSAVTLCGVPTESPQKFMKKTDAGHTIGLRARVLLGFAVLFGGCDFAPKSDIAELRKQLSDVEYRLTLPEIEKIQNELYPEAVSDQGMRHVRFASDIARYITKKRSVGRITARR